MAPPPLEERSPDEEPQRFLIDDLDGIPPFDPSSPVVGFSHDAHDPNISAHNTTLGDTAQVHRQPIAATESRDPSASGLSATPATCLAPSHVTRARDEQEPSVQSSHRHMPPPPGVDTSSSESVREPSAASRVAPPPPPVSDASWPSLSPLAPSALAGASSPFFLPTPTARPPPAAPAPRAKVGRPFSVGTTWAQVNTLGGRSPSSAYDEGARRAEARVGQHTGNLGGNGAGSLAYIQPARLGLEKRCKKSNLQR